MGSILGYSPAIQKSDFDTALPANFTEEDLDDLDYTAVPRPMEEHTETLVQLGKAMTAIFVKECGELGPLPSGDAELVTHYHKMLKLEKDYMESSERLFKPWRQFMSEGSNDWRGMIGKTGLAQRRTRLWRPFMVRGYADKRFEYATKTCVEGAQQSLQSLKRLYEIDAPLNALCESMSATCGVYRC